MAADSEELALAVTQEMAKIRAEAKANLAATNAALADADPENERAYAALQGAVDRNTALMQAVEAAEERITVMMSGEEPSVDGG